MRTEHLVTISAVSLFVLFAGGCSKRSGGQPHHVATPPNMTDLGAVELAPQIPKQFNLGTSKSCTLVGKQLPNGIEVKLVIVATNANGAVQRSQGQIDTLPGRQCAISIGDTMVELTPTLKTQ
jgi:hypothetical protein